MCFHLPLHQLFFSKVKENNNNNKKNNSSQASIEAFLPNEGSHLKFGYFQQPFLILENKILSWRVASEWTQIQRGGDSLELKDVLIKKKKDELWV